jgi:hypothetical protein
VSAKRGSSGRPSRSVKVDWMRPVNPSAWSRSRNEASSERSGEEPIANEGASAQVAVASTPATTQSPRPALHRRRRLWFIAGAF